MAMPAFAPGSRLESLLAVVWLLVEKGGCVTKTVARDIEGKDVEVEVDRIELLEIPFNWSSGVTWKLSALGFEQFLIFFEVQQCHNPEALL